MPYFFSYYKKIIATQFVVLIIFFLNSSCVSTLNNKETILIKSKPETPDWTKENWHERSVNPNYKNIIFKKNDVYNLSLGIKQIQNNAILKFKTAIPKDIYWEYRQQDTNNGPERFYTIWVLLSVLQ